MAEDDYGHAHRLAALIARFQRRYGIEPSPQEEEPPPDGLGPPGGSLSPNRRAASGPAYPVFRPEDEA